MTIQKHGEKHSARFECAALQALMIVVQMSVLRGWWILVFAIVLAYPLTTQAQSSGLFTQPKGALLIVGGGDTPISVQQRFVDLAGGATKAKIAVFPMASLKSDEEAKELVEDFQKIGADAQVVDTTQIDVNSQNNYQGA